MLLCARHEVCVHGTRCRFSCTAAFTCGGRSHDPCTRRFSFEVRTGARGARAVEGAMGEHAVKMGWQAKPRILTDLVGPYYTLVMETMHKDLASWEAEMKRDMGDAQVAYPVSKIHAPRGVGIPGELHDRRHLGTRGRGGLAGPPVSCEGGWSGSHGQRPARRYQSHREAQRQSHRTRCRRASAP